MAVHLAKAFESSPRVEFAGIHARNPEKILPWYSGPLSQNLENLQTCDLVLIAVSDDAIAEVSRSLPFTGVLVAHTSGSRPLEDIDPKNRPASFYPLQTFSRGRDLDYASIPVFLEAAAIDDYELLEQAALALGTSQRLAFAQRRAVHLSAVFACNFANHMFAIAEEICAENQVPFHALRPLIWETAQKVLELSPKVAQTGPAVRGDQKTIAAQLSSLQGSRAKIYQTITQSIIDESKKL